VHPFPWSMLRLAIVVAMPVLGATAPLAAQAPAPPVRGMPGRVWHAVGSLRLDEQSNDNVFLLSDTMRARLDTFTTPASPATRFADMRSVNDYITTLRAGLGIEGPGLFGRTLSFRSDADYDWYARNAKRRNIDLGFAVTQTFPYHGRLELRGRLVPSYFYRNFLADAIDLNGDGVIQSSERIYAAATYRDSRLLVGYRQRLIGSTKTDGFGATLELTVGRSARTYEAPLAYRSYRGPTVEATLALELARPWKLEVGYTHASLNSRADTAVLLLNEPDFNRDFNGNGTTTDLRVRSVQVVDFSRREQDLDLGLRAEVNQGVSARLHYEHRWRAFPSAQPFDVLNNSRRDRRDFMGLELSFRVGPRTHFSVGGDVEVQKVGRSLVPSLTEDVTAYKRNRFYAGWRFQV
jgi:hypothetical protein